MSCVTIVPSGTELDRPAARKFGSRSRLPKADPATVSRQASITLKAFQAHDDRAEALSFLNAHSDVLDGRPIDVAGETDAGLAAAMTLLAERTPA